MYWFRSIEILDLFLYLLLMCSWASGGWLLVTNALANVTPKLNGAERLISGLATGLVLFISLTNLLSQLLPLPTASWAAALAIFVAGLAVAGFATASSTDHISRLKNIWLDFQSLGADLIHHWSPLAFLAGLTFLLTLIGRGLALFDDYMHIPLVSLMATGDIPPHFYLNPTSYFSYHYGLQVLAASLVRSAGMFPWSAWDLSKALAIAMTVVLSWLWIRRVTRNKTGAWLGSIFTLLAGGTRWLLLLIPTSLLLRISSQVKLSNSAIVTGPDLVSVLARPWLIEGAGPYPFPFAFHNSINIPTIFSLGSSGALYAFTIILLLILARQRSFTIPGMIVIGLLISTLGLSAEHLFVLLWIGIAVSIAEFVILRWRQHSPIPRNLVLGWAIILLVAGILSVIQGGFLTEAVRRLFLKDPGVISAAGEGFLNLAPRWPPAIDSGHFGALSLLNPGQLIVWLAEVGPVLLMAPLVTLHAFKRLRRKDWVYSGLALAAMIGFCMILFLEYGATRSSARMQSTALWIWALLGFPLVWAIFIKSTGWRHKMLIVAYGVTVFAGIVILSVQLTAIPAPQLTYYIDSNDARISQKSWDRLPSEAIVIDSISYRAVALFGRPTLSNSDIFVTLPEWQSLIADPDPVSMANAGYDFVYIERDWWEDFKPRQINAFRQACVMKFDEYNPEDGDFRWLLDIRGCKAANSQ